MIDSNFSKITQERVGNNYKFTSKKICEFLSLLSTNGNVTMSAKLVGMNRRSIYAYAERNPEFYNLMQDARLEAKDLLLAEAWKRAVQGTEEPVFFQGKQFGTVTKYSDQLLALLIKGYYGVPHQTDKLINLSKDEEIKKPSDKSDRETIDYTNLSLSERKQLLALLEKCK